MTPESICDKNNRKITFSLLLLVFIHFLLFDMFSRISAFIPHSTTLNSLYESVIYLGILSSYVASAIAISLYLSVFHSL